MKGTLIAAVFSILLFFPRISQQDILDDYVTEVFYCKLPLACLDCAFFD